MSPITVFYKLCFLHLYLLFFIPLLAACNIPYQGNVPEQRYQYV